MITVYFEDHGQDFLEWDIKDGVVIACRPFQEWLWKGTKINNKSGIKKGDILQITTKDGGETTLKYPVEKVTLAELCPNCGQSLKQFPAKGPNQRCPTEEEIKIGHYL